MASSSAENQPLKLVAFPAHVEMETGSDLVLLFRYEGPSKALVTWMKNGSRIDTADSRFEYQQVAVDKDDHYVPKRENLKECELKIPNVDASFT